MATWRDSYTEQGKFRDATFYLAKDDAEFGRRTVKKEFPGLDNPKMEDIARATRAFSLEMFVIGEDYDAQRDALIAALETAGPGELVHPYWGTMTVSIDGPARISQSTKEGGIARITAKFVKTNEELKRVKRDATADVVTVSAADVQAAMQAQFGTAFTVINAIASVASDARQLVQDVTDAVAEVQEKIAAVIGLVDDATDAIEDVREAITDAIDTAGDILRSPLVLAAKLTVMYDAVVAGIASIGDAFDAAIAIFGGEDSVPAEGNIIAARTQVDVMRSTVVDLQAIVDAVFPALPSGDAQQNSIKRTNQEELGRLIKAAVVTAVANNVVLLTFESFDQAQDMRDVITAGIDDLLADSGLADGVYGPLCDLRAALCDHLAQVANSLPELVDYTPNVTLPALVLAYQIYGDSTRDADLLARNPQLRDPNAVPGGKAIQVIADE